MLLETIRSLILRLRRYELSSESITTAPDLETTEAPLNESSVPGREIDPPAFFPNAHHFVINNPSMVSNTIGSSGTVIQLLAQKRMPGAEVDSSARDPPPQCHPDTRKSLRSRIIHWFTNPRRDWRILWVLGPVGVGKSAVAQTIAEEFKASGRLGAAVFFSRHCRDDPDRVVATLAYQLAIQHPDYKNILTQRLADDSTILEKSRRSQFKQLVVEPFKMLAVRNTTCVQEPLLIVLDGLDECNGEEAQCELIELISEHAHLMSGLLWMICSRPEWHLQSILSQTDFHVRCKREELPVDDTEAQRDVSLVLQQSFYEIREKYRDRVDEGWPPEAQLRRIASTASGLFAFSSTLTRFVSDKYKGDPHGQLEVCMKFLDGVPGVVNPLHALDLLYRQMMCNIAAETLPTTMRILGLSILYPHVGLPARIQANFLCLDRTAFYRSLQQLHSVLYVPKPSDAHNTNMYFYHASFADFLRDPHRSGTFCLDQAAIHYDVAVHALRWNKRGIQFLKVERNLRCILFPELKWIGAQQEEEVILDALTRYSSSIGWIACCYVTKKDIPGLVAEIEQFDFSGLREIPTGFLYFLNWFYSLGVHNNALLRAINPTDHEAREVKHTLFLTDTNMKYPSYTSEPNPGYSFYQDVWNTHIQKFKLGKGKQACIVELATVRSYEYNDSLADYMI